MVGVQGGFVRVTPPYRPKRITGTKVASVLGLNKWQSPFQAWCELTRTYEEPFEENKYTRAGKIIEPKQIRYLQDKYPEADVVTPAEMFGEDYFEKTYGNFFPEEKVFGGMWDCYLRGQDGRPQAVAEMKTTRRPQDWEGRVPIGYMLQCCLYARLMEVEHACFVRSVLPPQAYSHPEQYGCNSQNTKIIWFRPSEAVPDFGDMIRYCEDWYEKHVVTGISPEAKTEKDMEFLEKIKEKEQHEKAH